MKLFKLLIAIAISIGMTAESLDLRVSKLSAYLEARRSPVAHLAPVFVDVADRNGLDWRLLPALAVVESGAGKACKNYNLFGWASGKHRFTTPEHAITTVGDALGTYKSYRTKTLNAALRTYNPVRRTYPQNVVNTMRLIDPGPVNVMLVSPNRTSLEPPY